jgi:hypothetical protein
MTVNDPVMDLSLALHRILGLQVFEERHQAPAVMSLEVACRLL